MIQPRPAEFADWRGNHNVMMDYAQWVHTQSQCPSLKLSISVPVDEIFAEAQASLHKFVTHRDNEGNTGWRSAAIHGISTQHTNSWNTKEYGFDTEPKYGWTQLADDCPVTTEWIKSFPCTRFQRVRFMLLEPGGTIALHRDNQQRALDAINVAITNPDECKFYMEDADFIPWKPGDVRLIDIGRYHTVVNNSSRPRIHMIIHGWWDIDIYRKTCESYDELTRLYL